MWEEGMLGLHRYPPSTNLKEVNHVGFRKGH